jgi:hypothetical protein
MLHETRGVLDDNGLRTAQPPDVHHPEQLPFHSLTADFTELLYRMNLSVINGMVEGLDTSPLQPRLDRVYLVNGVSGGFHQ